MFRRWLNVCIRWQWTGWLALVLAVSPSRGATDSAWFARAWQTEEGLPEHTTVALEQTRDGYLWLATYQGLFRFGRLEATAMRCHLDVARDLPAAPLKAEQRHSLFLAFKEALRNAVQHSSGTDLTVDIAAPEGVLTITVTDNGRGTDPAQAGADGWGNMKRRLQQLFQGKVSKEIADRLAISYHTVPVHLKHIYEKLHVRSHAEAMVKYPAGKGAPGDGFIPRDS